ncbi:MAG: sensor histidine kinase [Mangrovibacterium sp.]
MKKVKLSVLFPSKLFRVSLHVLFWLGLFILRSYLIRIGFNVYSGFPLQQVILLSLWGTLLSAAVFYASVYWIWPKFLLRRKYATAGALIVAVIVFYTFVDAFAEKQLLTGCPDCMEVLKRSGTGYFRLLSTDVTNIAFIRLISLGTPFSLLIFLAIPVSVKALLSASRNNIKRLRLAKDNLQLEYNFLKSQVNPHFLFNTLNNIYGLIIKGDNQRSAHLVSRLSELLRYILYDSNKETMPLNREVSLLEDYIELEKVRLNHIQVRFKTEIDNPDHEIAPLLLVPLVENAFKFSRDVPGSVINICLSVSNGQLCFSIDNPIDENRGKRQIRRDRAGKS